VIKNRLNNYLVTPKNGHLMHVDPKLYTKCPLGTWAFVGLLVNNAFLGWERNKRKENWIFLINCPLRHATLILVLSKGNMFNIPYHQTQLSEEVGDDLCHMQTFTNANIFLHNYTTHISIGIYDITRIFLKGFTIETKSTTKLKTLLKTITINLTGGVKFGYMRFDVGVKVIICMK